MALDKDAFKTALKTDLLAMAAANNADGVTREEAMDRFAGVIADRVDAYIKTLTITIATGLVQVEGTAVAQANVAPIVIIGGVS
jgi:hypothetical protein